MSQIKFYVLCTMILSKQISMVSILVQGWNMQYTNIIHWTWHSYENISKLFHGINNFQLHIISFRFEKINPWKMFFTFEWCPFVVLFSILKISKVLSNKWIAPWIDARPQNSLTSTITIAKFPLLTTWFDSWKSCWLHTQTLTKPNGLQTFCYINGGTLLDEHACKKSMQHEYNILIVHLYYVSFCIRCFNFIVS